jgi:MFS family permease
MSKFNPLRAVAFLIPEPGPKRIFALSTFINTFGWGLVWTSMTLFLTKELHLSTRQVGVGMTLAGLVGLLGGMPIGDLADRRGPREIVRAVLLVQGIVTLCYVFVQGFFAFLVVVSLEVLCYSAYGAANGALVRRVGGDDVVAYRSQNRAIASLGMSIGTLFCGAAITIGTPLAYRSLIIGDAVTFLFSWAILARIPKYEPLPKPEGKSGSRWVALSDAPFVAYVALAGLLSMQYWVITQPLPLWVVNNTHAPRWSVSLFLLINTVLVVLFQARIGKSAGSIRAGGNALRRAGIMLLVSCSAIGLAVGLAGWAALLLLIGAVVLLTVAELWYVSGTYAFEFGLPPAHAQGQYQGLSGIGITLGATTAPILMVGVVLSLGQAGWVGLGVVFLLLGLVAPAVARWGERTRPAEEAVSETPASSPQPAPVAAHD